jgi:hypothetical protein
VNKGRKFEDVSTSPIYPHGEFELQVKAPDVQETVVMSSLHLNNNDMGRLQASPCEKLYLPPACL